MKNDTQDLAFFKNRVAELEKKQLLLQAENEHFKQLYEKAPLSYQSLDKNGCFIEVNQAWLDNLGYSREEVIGKNFGDFIHPDWQDHYQENFPKFKVLGEILGAEFKMLRKDGSELVVSLHGKIGRDSKGHFLQTHCIFEDITERRLAEETLKQIEWMLSPKSAAIGTEVPADSISDRHCGDQTTLNRSGLIARSISKQILQSIVSEYLDLLETTSAVYEKNGDYALKLFSSAWCSMMDSASRGLCNTADEANTLISDKWLCHQSCWACAAKQAIETQGPIDVECNGGLRLYAIPIFANNEVIGAITFGYGDPPQDLEKLQGLADSYSLDHEQLLQTAKIYQSRPPFIIELAKKRLQMSADLISLLVERKITEEKIRLSEAHHRTLINTIPDLVWLKDVDGVYLSCNRSFGRLYNTTESQIIGKTDDDFNAPQIADFIQRHDRKAMHANGPSVNEEHLTLPDNGYRGLFETIKTPMRDGEGNIIGILGIARDITERKEKDQQLHDLIRDQSAILNNVPNIIFFKDTKNNLIKITESVAKATGLPRSAIEGRPSKEIYPDMADKYWEDDLEVIRTGKPKLGFVEALPTADGKTKWLLTDKIPYFENDQVVGILVISTDISDRVEYENRLKESEKKFKSLFENAADAIYLFSMDGKILDVNTSAQQQTGYSREELLTMEVNDFDLKTVPIKDRQKFWHKIAFGEVTTLSKQHLKKDRTPFPVEISLSKIELQGDVVLLAFVRDVTEKVETEILLRQSQKMEAVGTLAGGIAHDFNNILAAILGYGELAQENCAVGSIIAQDIEQILQAGNRAKGLVKQILAISRQAESERIHFQPAIIIKEAVNLLRSSLPTTITIKRDIDMRSDLIFADPTEIHQIVMNLCTNSFHAMEERGGVLSISLKNTTVSKQDFVNNPLIKPGNFVELTIKDNGTGIAPEIMPKIFDPYFTTKETGKGTGLGLAIVHGIIKSYGGHITCQNQVEKGTIFTVLLPAIDKQTVAETKQVELIPAGTEHILMVDDEEILVNIGKIMLERLGYRVTTRTSSLEALNSFITQPETFDLIITDQTMPGMTGIDLARRMLQIRPQLPIILSTGHNNLISEENARSFGIKGFALKPIAMKDIAALIRKVLDEDH